MYVEHTHFVCLLKSYTIRITPTQSSISFYYYGLHKTAEKGEWVLIYSNKLDITLKIPCRCSTFYHLMGNFQRNGIYCHVTSDECMKGSDIYYRRERKKFFYFIELRQLFRDFLLKCKLLLAIEQ